MINNLLIMLDALQLPMLYFEACKTNNYADEMSSQAARRSQLSAPRPLKLSIDHRKADRIEAYLPMCYRISVTGRQLVGRTSTKNVSGRGLQFPIPWEIPRTTRCRLRLTLPDRRKPLALDGRVIWCHRKKLGSANWFDLGVDIAASRGQDDAFGEFCQFVAARILEQYLA